MSISCVRAVAPFLLAATAALGQLYAVRDTDLTPPPVRMGLGCAIAEIDDVDGDGVHEIAVGAYGPVSQLNWASPGPGAGVELHSGATGALIYAVSPPVAAERFGFSIAAIADLDGDGVRDLVVGAPAGTSLTTGAVYLLSGANGAVLFSTHSSGSAPEGSFGVAICAIGDWNGDGTPDFAVGAPGPYVTPSGTMLPANATSSGGAVFIHSGAGGALLQTLMPQAGDQSLGRVVVNGGDLDGDGKDDLLIGGVRLVRAYGGGGGAVLFSASAPPFTTEFGLSAARIADVTGDGVPDFAVGARTPIGCVYVLSGAGGAIVGGALTLPNSSGYFGGAIASAGDWNGDGTPDLLISDVWATTAGFSTGRVVVMTTGGLLLASVGGAPHEQLGDVVLTAGDLDGDGIADVVVGAANAITNGSFAGGRLRVFSGGTLAPRWITDGEDGYDDYGAACAALGDLDGDGASEYAVGAPAATAQGRGGAGRVIVYSGATGAVRLSIGGGAYDGAFGSSIAACDDIDGDGVADFAVGAPHELPGALASGPFASVPGAVTILSGASGAVIRTVNSPNAGGDGFGWSLATIDDVDGDGVADLLCGAPGPATVGRAHVLSPTTGAVLRSHVGATAVRFGACVTQLPDIDLDGVAEYGVGAPGGAFSTVLPTFTVYAGATGAVINVVSGALNDGFGTSAAALQDVTGDGIPDFAVGAANAFGFIPSYVAIVAGGTAVIASQLPAPPSGSPFAYSTFASVLATAPDLDGDGLSELVVADPYGGAAFGFPGSVRVYSAFGIERGVEFGTGGRSFGTSVAVLPDLDGDGMSELLVGAPRFALLGTTTVASSDQASIRSFIGLPDPSASYGAGCAAVSGLTPLVRVTGGLPVASGGNSEFALCVLRGPQSGAGLLLAGPSQTTWSGGFLPLPLASIGMPGCALRTSTTIIIPVAFTAAGFACVRVPVPNDPSLVGGSLFFQSFVLNPLSSSAPGALSAGLRVTAF